ncbi:ABC transporter transmembrane domain-containing protein, partial [Streptococcus suis]
MTKAVHGATKELRQDLSHKINKITVSYFYKHQYGDLLGSFTSDVETVSNALQQSFLHLVNAVVRGSLASFMFFWLDVSQ